MRQSDVWAEDMPMELIDSMKAEVKHYFFAEEMDEAG